MRIPELHVILIDQPGSLATMNIYSWRRIFLLFVILVLAAVAVAAQDTQRFETFAGFSLTHDSSFAEPGTNYSGWDTSTNSLRESLAGLHQ